jgi:hypothetical protein
MLWRDDGAEATMILREVVTAGSNNGALPQGYGLLVNPRMGSGYTLGTIITQVATKQVEVVQSCTGRAIQSVMTSKIRVLLDFQ